MPLCFDNSAKGASVCGFCRLSVVVDEAWDAMLVSVEHSSNAVAGDSGQLVGDSGPGETERPAPYAKCCRRWTFGRERVLG